MSKVWMREDHASEVLSWQKELGVHSASGGGVRLRESLRPVRKDLLTCLLANASAGLRAREFGRRVGDAWARMSAPSNAAAADGGLAARGAGLGEHPGMNIIVGEMMWPVVLNQHKNMGFAGIDTFGSEDVMAVFAASRHASSALSMTVLSGLWADNGLPVLRATPAYAAMLSTVDMAKHLVSQVETPWPCFLLEIERATFGRKMFLALVKASARRDFLKLMRDSMAGDHSRLLQPFDMPLASLERSSADGEGYHLYVFGETARPEDAMEFRLKSLEHLMELGEVLGRAESQSEGALPDIVALARVENEPADGEGASVEVAQYEPKRSQALKRELEAAGLLLLGLLVDLDANRHGYNADDDEILEPEPGEPAAHPSRPVGVMEGGRKERNGERLPLPWEIKIGKDVRVDLTKEVTEYVQGGGTSSPLTSQSFTRGHYKRVAYGKRWSLRRWQRISAYVKNKRASSMKFRRHVVNG